MWSGVEANWLCYRARLGRIGREDASFVGKKGMALLLGVLLLPVRF
jgi:hypothetical protein